MKKVIMEEGTDIIRVENLKNATPVFAKKDGKMQGMVIKEESGWILRIGGSLGCSGYHSTMEKCISDAAVNHNYEFFIE